MFKWIKRFFGLDYNDDDASVKHSGVGYSGLASESNEVASAPVEEAKPVKEKKPRKPAAKKVATKKTAKKAK